MRLRADQVNACEPGALSEEALHGNTQSTKTAWQKARNRAIHHADTYGDTTKLLITVKLAEL